MHFHKWGKWEKKGEIETKIGGVRRGGKYHLERVCEHCGHVQVKTVIIP